MGYRTWVLIFAGSLGCYLACGNTSHGPSGTPQTSGGASGDAGARAPNAGAAEVTAGGSQGDAGTAGSEHGGEGAKGGGGGAAGQSSGGAAGEPSGGMSGQGGAGGSRSVELLFELARTLCSPPCQTPDPEACVRDHVDRAPTEALLSGRLVFDEARLEECLLALADETCAELPLGVCTNLYAGTRSVGESCFAGRECRQSGDGVACVDKALLSDTGICRPVVVKKEGEECDVTCMGDCAVESGFDQLRVCRWEDALACVNRFCEPLAKEGQACVGDQSCGDFDSCYHDPDYNPTDFCFFSNAGCARVACDAEPACRHERCWASRHYIGI